MSKQTIPRDGTVCASYEHISDLLDQWVGYCQFSDSITACSGNPSFCTRGGDQLSGVDRKKEVYANLLEQELQDI
jgi:hypothetical protein